MYRERVFGAIARRAAALLLCSPLMVGQLSLALPERQQGTPESRIIPWGTAWAVSRGPTIGASLVRAADGAHKTRLLIDEHTPGCQHRIVPITGGLRHVYGCSFAHPVLGKIAVEAELDILGPRPDGAYDLLPRITKLPAALAVHSLGVELEMLEQVGQQTMFLPVFSGAEFLEPAFTIRGPIDTDVGHCMQITAYYGEEGSGLMLFARDPAATKPKHLLYRSGHNGNGLPVAALALEYYMPNAHLGGVARAAPVATALLPYTFVPAKMPGWYPAAKLYRAWVEKNCRGAGLILERGPLASRTDVPKWMLEVDVLIWELFGWFPDQAVVPDPLLHLRRLQKDIGAKSMFVGLWFWNDRKSDYGRLGSWLPLPATVRQIKALLPDGIRFAGYTFPGVFDTRNPLLHSLGLYREAAEDRDGSPRVFDWGPGQVALEMDVASAVLADWYAFLGEYHATESGMSGFYSDFPACVGWEDFVRPSGERGITEAAYKGYAQIMRRTQEAANRKGRDFVQYHEAAYEWLIKCSPFGEGAVGVIGRTYPGERRTRGVPFFQTVYSGYTLFWIADERFGPQMLTLVADTYGDMRESNMTRMLAEGFTWGNMINTSEIALKDGKLNHETNLGKTFKDAFLHHNKTLRDLIVVRRLARPWLVLGEMLNSPVIGGDRYEMTLHIPMGGTLSYETFDKPRVPATAWRGADGTVRLVAANGSRGAGKVIVDLTRIDLTKKWALVDDRANQTFRPDSSGRITINVDGGTARLLRPLRL